MKRVTGLVLAASVLSGCVSTSAYKSNEGASPYLIKQAQAKPQSCEPLTKEQELVFSLSKEMMAAKRLHAALANLERLPAYLPEARLGKAQVLRLLGRPEAEGLYQSLLESCLVAEGHHGLAQMAVLKKDNDKALQHLQQAIGFEPTNEAMRNDMGVVYMNQRQLDEARFEFLTAIELNEGEQRALRNLLILMLYQDNFDGAAKLASRYQVSTSHYQAALSRAQMMKQEDGDGAASAVASRAAPVPAAVTSPVMAQPRRAESLTEEVIAQPVPPTEQRVVRAVIAPDKETQAGETVPAQGVSRVQGVQRIQAASQPIVPITVR
ncbi:tetratricopeptide repeat protein [Zobellella iuensis]|uniref:Tetratricopeptide repeat protein n=1 Tax=Zobellella iuensis TaxID=2803811 RepID=A0ABS1QP18_9GAMM|nr:tetratricopeptide repeat protein [Zobellella iuensis]MBL1376600.1 tetratricopeptide repeat protein [Zobellella iuensis]